MIGGNPLLKPVVLKGQKARRTHADRQVAPFIVQRTEKGLQHLAMAERQMD
jgi:hypothetical protein